MTGTDYYDRHGAELADRYDAIDPTRLNAAWAPLLQGRAPGRACDIGAGSGRDARWLAGLGWHVLAVEPSATFRDRTGRGGEERIRWMDDRLPSLAGLRALDTSFDLLLVSAVWQHLPPSERPLALQALRTLLAPEGLLVITLRLGRNQAENRERGFEPVSAEELVQQARQQGLAPALQRRDPDLQRDDLDWETVVLHRAGR